MNNIDKFKKELEELINKYSMEKYLNLPDYVLAKLATEIIINKKLDKENNER